MVSGYWHERRARRRKNMLWEEAVDQVQKQQPKLDTIDRLCAIVHRYEQLLGERPQEIGPDLLERPR